MRSVYRPRDCGVFEILCRPHSYSELSSSSILHKTAFTLIALFFSKKAETEEFHSPRIPPMTLMRLYWILLRRLYGSDRKVGRSVTINNNFRFVKKRRKF